jgi:oxygen-independent coproporphyrinogen-3 oxidase
MAAWLFSSFKATIMADEILQLLNKYDVPTPRYTSYPTVPYWNFTLFDENKWRNAVINRFKAEDGALCIYIHLPFCENLCTFCACNKRITKNHAVEDPYISTVLKEWKMYREMLPGKPIIKEIHLGGGTPTFFSPSNLVRLINGITADAIVAPNQEFSVEVHPNYTTEAHLEQLASVGFNRISLGVQDFDPKVQFLINRIQSFEQTNEVVEWARKNNYQSINIDLVYGLPHQTISSIEHSIERIKSMMPDRIAFYSYAHVPWKSKGQRRYTEADLPNASQKWEMYHKGKTLLEQSGFHSIGMDHFALADDPLFTAAAEGKLHRNFMGYTTTNAKLLLGLGASSISDSWDAFAQNEKEIEVYEQKINAGILPLVNGHLLTAEDLVVRKNILDLMCHNQTELEPAKLSPGLIRHCMDGLENLQADGLAAVEGNHVTVTGKGKLFVRNICACLDAHLWQSAPASVAFSKAI